MILFQSHNKEEEILCFLRLVWCYLLITNSQGSRRCSLEHIQGTQIRLVASWVHLPKARPPEGVFKCSGYKFTSHPRWNM